MINPHFIGYTKQVAYLTFGAMTTKMTEEEVFKLIGSKIRELRIKKGFTNYEHFAYEIDVSRSLYGRYENGANMKISSLLKILNGLDITLTDFFNQLDA